jgi:hypothetical protein
VSHIDQVRTPPVAWLALAAVAVFFLAIFALACPTEGAEGSELQAAVPHRVGVALDARPLVDPKEQASIRRAHQADMIGRLAPERLARDLVELIPPGVVL